MKEDIYSSLDPYGDLYCLIISIRMREIIVRAKGVRAFLQQEIIPRLWWHIDDDDDDGWRGAPATSHTTQLSCHGFVFLSIWLWSRWLSSSHFIWSILRPKLNDGWPFRWVSSFGCSPWLVSPRDSETISRRWPSIVGERHWCSPGGRLKRWDRWHHIDMGSGYILKRLYLGLPHRFLRHRRILHTLSIYQLSLEPVKQILNYRVYGGVVVKFERP